MAFFHFINFKFIAINIEKQFVFSLIMFLLTVWFVRHCSKNRLKTTWMWNWESIAPIFNGNIDRVSINITHHLLVVTTIKAAAVSHLNGSKNAINEYLIDKWKPTIDQFVLVFLDANTFSRFKSSIYFFSFHFR